MGDGGNEWMGPPVAAPRDPWRFEEEIGEICSFLLEGKQQQMVKNSPKTKQNSALETRLFYRKRKSFHHSKSINFAGAGVFFVAWRFYEFRLRQALSEVRCFITVGSLIHG